MKKLIEKQFGNIHVVIGLRKKTRGKNPVCPICKKQIVEKDKGVCIKSLGEYKREYHFNCIEGLCSFISGR